MSVRWIYLSPHFDDAVLSCGGLIWEQTASGMPVEIWTVFAGDPPPGRLSQFAAKTHADWGTGNALETVALRRVEDRNAVRKVGAVAHHFPLTDCIYRRHPVSGKHLYTETVFRKPARVETYVADTVAKMLSSRLTKQDTLVCPLAMGNHVDHVLTRKATEQLGRPLLYYADVPYLFNFPEQLPKKTNALLPLFYSVTRDGLRAWQSGIAAYASQISGLFPDLDSMRHSIKTYWSEKRGIDLWHAE